MGGGSITHEDSCSDQDFPFLSSPLSPRDTLRLENKDNRVTEQNGLDFGEVSEESIETSSSADFVISERKRLIIYHEILQSYDELKIDSNNLKEAKEKILRYRPGTWTEKVGGLKLCDYDVPETTCLILVGPSGSGKSSLINRISKVFDDDKFAPERAQISYNSLIVDGTYFLREFMIPRESNSICLYDTRSLSDNSHENSKMLKNWMTKGVRHGELVVRSRDSQRLSKSLKCKSGKKGFFSSKRRKVNFVICVVNGLSVLNAMENARGDLEAQYIEAVVSTFNCAYLSFKVYWQILGNRERVQCQLADFKLEDRVSFETGRIVRTFDDKPVLVLTHGDLLSLTDRARVRAYLGELLGIPPTKQIFDIPDCDDLVTESAILGMLRYTLEHADRNFPQKSNVMNKVHKISLSLFMILLILGIGFGIGLEQNKFMHKYHAYQAQTPQPKTCSRIVQDMHPDVDVSENEPKIEHRNLKVPTKEPKIKRRNLKVPKKEPKIEWHKIRHIW
ncbi:hypothetical protein TSUD_175280 [Trifolium subterraneum]|uniref:G domain-containing protein n=1 Tax=Trifolium subterraneum TaxID=3900 RepID=A0A2Z6LHI9_TRISU|nr:hypothetical protein TSUD_175280 [Trifolium subterraneum]